jgi:hypothetical protein
VAEVKLRLTKSQHQELFDHLFPGDGLEAVALALCGSRAATNEEIAEALAKRLASFAKRIEKKGEGGEEMPG